MTENLNKSFAENRLYLKQGRNVRCEKCKIVYKIPFDVYEDLLPISLKCPKCDCDVFLTKPIPLPKLDPNKEKLSELEWKIVSTENIIENKNITITKRVANLKKILSRGLNELDSLHEEITEFAVRFINHFESEAVELERIITDWRPEYLREFIKYPFISVPLNCKNEISRLYSRFILCPKFFDFGIGIPLETDGAFRLRLINQFTHFSEYDDAYNYLKLPKRFNIEVRGDRLIGRDLLKLKDEIPGIIGNFEDTSQFPSAVITNFYTCKKYLVQHGIKCWGKEVINRKEYTRWTFDLDYGKEVDEAREKFLNNGRLAIFRRKTNEARHLAASIIGILKGAKMLLVNQHKYGYIWRSMIKEPYELIIRDETFGLIESHNLNKLKFIIVDVDSGVSEERIKQLYDYKGNLILIHNDPLMDWANECEKASLIYGLVNCCMFDKVTEKWNKGGMDTVKDELYHALKRLQKESCK